MIYENEREEPEIEELDDPYNECFTVYGFPCVNSPLDFTPDSESCTILEIEKHKKDSEDFINGNWTKNIEDFCHIEENKIVTKTPWGIGVNRVHAEPCTCMKGY